MGPARQAVAGGLRPAEVSLTLTFDDVSLTYVWPGDAPDEHED